MGSSTLSKFNMPTHGSSARALAFVLLLAPAFDQTEAGRFYEHGIRASTPSPDAVGICASTVIPNGYNCEEHEVITEDGYILSMQRMPMGRAENRSGGDRKQPVLLQHGILMHAPMCMLLVVETNQREHKRRSDTNGARNSSSAAQFGAPVAQLQYGRSLSVSDRQLCVRSKMSFDHSVTEPAVQRVGDRPGPVERPKTKIRRDFGVFLCDLSRWLKLTLIQWPKIQTNLWGYKYGFIMGFSVKSLDKRNKPPLNPREKLKRILLQA